MSLHPSWPRRLLLLALLAVSTLAIGCRTAPSSSRGAGVPPAPDEESSRARAGKTPAPRGDKTTYTAETIPATAGFPLTVTDDVGATMTFDGPPQRIVSLAPSLTELLFALGLADRIVGVTNWCKYPPEALKKTKVGGYINSSLEQIVALAPDLVVATRGTPQTFMQSLRGSGIKVFAVDQTTLHQIETSMIVIGHLCGAADKGRQIAGSISSLADSVRDKTKALAAAQKPRALFVIQFEPIFVAGPGSYQDDILRDCGAANIARTGKPFAPLSDEIVVTADPQVLVMTSDQLGKLSREQMLAKLRQSATFGHTAAVRDSRLIVVPVDHISIPGPRLVLGIRELAQQLHPELFKSL